MQNALAGQKIYRPVRNKRTLAHCRAQPCTQPPRAPTDQCCHPRVCPCTEVCVFFARRNRPPGAWKSTLRFGGEGRRAGWPTSLMCVFFARDGTPRHTFGCVQGASVSARTGAAGGRAGGAQAARERRAGSARAGKRTGGNGGGAAGRAGRRPAGGNAGGGRPGGGGRMN